jgi:hypothetical protein
MAKQWPSSGNPPEYWCDGWLILPMITGMRPTMIWDIKLRKKGVTNRCLNFYGRW